MAGNIYHLIPPHFSSEIFETIFQSNNIHIERIISTGQVTPENTWLFQEKDEWVILLQGNSSIEFEDGYCCDMKCGDYLFIPGNRKHRITFTSITPPCIWLAVHGSFI